ncbi:MAG: hypothetical protein EOO09_16565 [Chitinophagaceae bacterium]|nr:MAG: hypothetical protein EOO09_16565 [Chitinophagaceae bacterium]
MVFVFQMDTANLERLSPVRAMRELRVCIDGETTWLQLENPGPVLPDQIRQLPFSATYELKNGLLFPPGKPTPVADLPQLAWTTPAAVLPLELPVSLLPGQVTGRVALVLLPGETEQESTVLMTGYDSWKLYGETASQTRLDRVSYAVSEDGSILVMGDPLPALPGRAFYVSGDFILPSGFVFNLPVELFPQVMQQVFPADNWILFDRNSTWTAIPKNYFVNARRSGIRALIKPAHD